MLAVLAALLLAPRAAHAPGVGLEVHEKPGKPGRFETAFEAMGTSARLEVKAADADAARRMFAGAVERIVRVERLMSTYRPDSEVSALNRLGAERPVALSEDTMRVVKAALEMSRLSGGAFDVTYAPLRTLWRAAQREGRLPREEQVQQARRAVGCDKLLLDGKTARFAAPGMEVDLGGIAKGYAVDAAVEALRAAGAQAGLVDLGGDLRFFGAPGPGARWLVEVRKPPGVEADWVLAVPACAVTTSGDYERWFSVEGRHYSHIVDPRTGWPVAGVPSVTVVAPDATTADGLATAVSVLGAREGIRLVDSLPETECMIMTLQADGSVRTDMSAGFSRLVEER